MRSESDKQFVSQTHKLDVQMVEFIKHFQEVAHVSGNSVKRGSHYIEAMPACIRQELV
jgi:hypothetical protein